MPDLAGTVSEGEEEEVDVVSRPASCSLSRDGHSSMKMPSTISVSSSSAAPSGKWRRERKEGEERERGGGETGMDEKE